MVEDQCCWMRVLFYESRAAAEQPGKERMWVHIAIFNTKV